MQGEEIFQTLPEGDWRKKGKKKFRIDENLLSSNPKILKAFSKTVPTKMIPTKGQAKETNEASKAKEQVD